VLYVSHHPQKLDTVWRDILSLPENAKPNFHDCYIAPVIGKYGDLQWRISHGAFPTGRFLFKACLNSSDKCPFCDEVDTLQHIFFDCTSSDNLLYLASRLVQEDFRIPGWWFIILPPRRSKQFHSSQIEDIDGLKIIHISGTKGKGSVAAFCESILRANGYKTGFYSSPHLWDICERYRVNNIPLTKADFCRYFYDVYKKVDSTKDAFGGLMPCFKRFPVLMAFHVFIQEKVDVFILEVSIGGEYDATNVVRYPTVTGTTCLDFDHTNMLGKTLDKIAWHKAGIFKPGRPAFTVPQPECAMDTLVSRANEKHTPIQLVPNLDTYDWQGKPIKLGIAGEHQHMNASLAIQLCATWMEENNESIGDQKTNFESIYNENLNGSIPTAPAFTLPDTFIHGLQNCYWPGRTQTIKRENVTYYLDSAHTKKSIVACVKWFKGESAKEEQLLGRHCVRVLIFNISKGRDPIAFMGDIKRCNFLAAAFCPDITLPKENVLTKRIEEVYPVVRRNRDTWLLEEEAEFSSDAFPRKTTSAMFTCALHAVQWASCGKDSHIAPPESRRPNTTARCRRSRAHTDSGHRQPTFSCLCYEDFRFRYFD
ncbi:folylpolyglutamate synthase, mitochondrial-like, partial [Saccoglossus kowalevskii]|uniref:tetrahydrofolate synthase n=1 Tax=Saccoglossus kowalevskii TaxID=10224 RepID=A0ABM0GXA8_SACKO